MSSSPPNKMNPLWMCLYFDSLALEIFSRGEKSSIGPGSETQKNQPVVIIEKHRVFQLNEAAMNLGIKPGNSMDTAYTLSDQMISFERNEDKEISTLSHLAQWAYQFTPNVSIKAPNCLLLDIRGCLKLFRGLATLTTRIMKSLEQLGYHPVASTNTTPLAAILVARASRQVQDSVRRIQENHDGVFIYKEICKEIDTEDVIESIKQIPIRYLQADEKILTSLQQMGIHNVGDLVCLPLSGLTRRFGVFFTDYLQRLIGAKSDPQKFINPEAKFLHDITFLSDVTHLDSLTFPVNRLLDELGEFLTTRQLHVSHFTWHLSHRNHGRKSFSIYLANPENEPKVFLALTRLKLDQINDIKEIDNIALAAHRFFPAKAINNDLFQGPSFPAEHGPHLQTFSTPTNHQLLNMFRARLGNGHCFGLSQSDDHRPEKAWKMERPGGKAAAPVNKSGAENEPPRPGFLLSTPQALTVINDIPCLSGKLKLLKGPERIDYGWWDQPLDKPLARDYYVARQDDGSLYWIFQHIAMRRWYLHGIFS